MELLPKIQEIFAKIFGVDSALVTLQTDTSNLVEWDSMHHLELISALEQGLSVKFKLTEMMALTSVAKIIEIVQKKKAPK